MVHEARHLLLGVGSLLAGSGKGAAVEALDDGRIAHMVDGFLGGEEAGLDTIVHIATLETDPMALPTHTRVGVVSVPLAREEQEHIARLDLGLRTMGTLEDTFAFGIIEQLVLIEHAPLLDVKVIAVGMALGGVGIAGGNLFVAYGADGEAPFQVALRREHIFTVLHTIYFLEVRGER